MSDIKYAYPLILNKVASPQYVTPILRRARLLDWLNEAANCRAVVIAADAGYGKTTLLWQWEREVLFPCYWYKLDKTDRDWTFHISYIIEAVSKHHRGFGRRAHSMLQQMGGPGTSRPGVTAHLVAEMHERLTEPCTFIIDDWHYVNAATEVRGLWNQVLRDAPATCRFVFLSRAKPQLQFARFKTHGGYAELRTDALRFTTSEITELFRDVYNDPLEPAEITELERHTEGWAASLQLVEVSLRNKATPEDRRQFLGSISGGSDSNLFSFLAEEVLDQQTDETRNFLLSTSILQQITPEVAERLAGVHDGRRALVELEHRGLFTNRLDDIRFRYHNLFREFLERRLHIERGEAEITGLHIHAASYFETTEQWPEAIHHYLMANLHRQAARLMARYGEEVIADGRLGLVDGWLNQLPAETIRANARLSLLMGEACGVRGEWSQAITALERAQRYFNRKGDRRFEALASLKLSSVYSNFGDPERAAEYAQSGLDSLPSDAIATRLRLEGNLAVTRTWLTEPLDHVLKECRRIGVEATSRGLDHFAAVANHNAGVVLNRMGRSEEAIQCLELAANYWGDPPTSPFADNIELVKALISSGDTMSAERIAINATIRTKPWPRPHAIALWGLARVHVANGRFDEAVRVIDEALKHGSALGTIVRVGLDAELLEVLYLIHDATTRMVEASERMLSVTADPRDAAEIAPARALAMHVATRCGGDCLTIAAELENAEAGGALGTAISGEVKIGALLLAHGGSRRGRRAWNNAARALQFGMAVRLRYWLRLYAPYAVSALHLPNGATLIAQLAEADPEGWRGALLAVVAHANQGDRSVLLQAILRTANRETVDALSRMEGSDIAEVRRNLRRRQAARLFLRTFGGIYLHRGDWSGPVLTIDRKRVRMLLALLASHSLSSLTRDMVIDALWPDADVNAAVNSLNQTVFQLRRYIDAGYRMGESPEYVISTADLISLNPDLIRTDLDEIRALPDRLRNCDWQQRQAIARRAIDLVRGVFLADLPYEDWASVQQLAIHGEVREYLFPIASAPSTLFEADIAERAATALILLDPFDEPAILALAETLSRTGRRVAARALMIDFVQRLRAEISEDPSPQFLHTAAGLGTSLSIPS